jgi:hypothetical protein
VTRALGIITAIVAAVLYNGHTGLGANAKA